MNDQLVNFTYPRMKDLLFITLFTLLAFSLSAQPDPCGPTAEMTSFCDDACVICDIDGFTGRNDLSINGQSVGNFCTTFAHNMSFISFIAGTVDLEIEVAVSNCTSGWGLEIGIFESFDCDNFTPVTFCNTDVSPNTTVSFSNDVPLVVGQHYYLMMDGSAGDICDWTFTVINGSTEVSPLTTSGMVSSVVAETCPGFPTRFNVMGAEVGAALFHWDVNGDRVTTTNQPAADITFPADGTYEVCVTAANVCDEAPPTCTTIGVRTVGSLSINQQICMDDTLFVADTFLTTAGVFDFVIVLPNGCDSLIDVMLEVLPQARQAIDVNLCVGDEFFIGTTPYSTTGLFIDTILTTAQCDSIVTLDLFMIECEIRGSTSFIQPVCNGEANGQLIFSVENGTPPFTYDWENILDPNVGGTGSTNLLINNAIDGVPVGVYEINIQDNFGNDVVLFQTVTEPTELFATVTAANVGDFNLSCFDGADGRVSGNGTGGVGPYGFSWSNAQNGTVIGNLEAGIYILSVTDANGCIRTDTVSLIAPPAINYTVIFNDPSCDGLETGSIELGTISGGTTPYQMALGNAPTDTIFTFPELPSGTYTANLVDANGCEVDSTESITAPEIPIIFPWEPTSTRLGCDVVVPTLINDITVADIRWFDLSGTLNCDTCLRPRAQPVNETEYVLTVTSADGCSTTDSLTISVIKVRDVYTPTAFSPNGDGINDFFNVNPGKSVMAVSSFRVFGRWGEQVYEGVDLIPNDLTAGWNGTLNNELMPTGVYAWVAQVLFLDGEVQQLTGEVVLLR